MIMLMIFMVSIFHMIMTHTMVRGQLTVNRH